MLKITKHLYSNKIKKRNICFTKTLFSNKNFGKKFAKKNNSDDIEKKGGGIADTIFGFIFLASIPVGAYCFGNVAGHVIAHRAPLPRT